MSEESDDSNLKALKHIRQHADLAKRKWEKIHTRMRMDLRYASGVQGAQWDESDVKVRGKNRAQFSFPVLDKFVERLVGGYNKSPYGIGYDGATSQAAPFAKLIGGMAQGIEAKSKAVIAYRTALRNSAACGYGWIYLTTDYADEYSEGNEVEAKICAVYDPTSMMLDPLSVEIDGSDAQWAIHRDTMGLQAAKDEFGDDVIDAAQGLGQDIGFVDERAARWSDANDSIPVITHWELEHRYKNVWLTPEGSSEKEVKGAPRKRIKETECKVTKVVGNKVVSETRLPVRCLLVMPVYGIPYFRDSEVQYKGMIHGAIDAQKLLNYSQSLGAERLALGPKANYFAPARAVGKYQELWKNSSRDMNAVLPYDDIDKDGKPIAPPTQLNNAVDVSDVANLSMAYNQLIELVVGMPSEGFGSDGPRQQTAEEALLRSQASETIASSLYENLRSSIERAGYVLAEMILATHDTDRVVPVMIEGKLTRQSVPSLENAPLSLADLNVEVKSGPLLASQRKESLRSYLALGQMLGEWRGVILDKIAENMDDADPEVVKRLQVVGQMMLQQGDGGAAAAQQAQAAKMENDQLRTQLQQAQQQVLAMQASVKEQEMKIMADLAKQEDQQEHEVRMAILKQAGANAELAQKIDMETDKDSVLMRQELEQRMAERAAEMGMGAASIF